ncbi:hypothetical protein [Hyphococcus sp.]|uniref:hypothetical protein n=1 Tax=Hyphococcus sp. TaxID=2038636 RepID=UPI003CCBD25F
MATRRQTIFNRLLGFLAANVIAVGPASAESRSYVISWFAQATYTQEGDCEGGQHPEVELQYLKNLEPLGYSEEEIAEYRRKLLAGEPSDLMQIMGRRGRIDGEPVNPYTHPAAVADPMLPSHSGKFAFGFDLDGAGAESEDAYTDPVTGEAGVDHEMYRALGCARSFRGTLEGRPTYWAWAWGQTKESQPAWLITVTGPDAGEDGPATIRIERALEHLVSNSDGSPRAHMTYRVDPDPRSRNEFEAEIEGGRLHITEHERFRMLQNPLVAPVLELENAHLRMNLDDGADIHGFIGGYQPWEPIYFGFGQIGIGGELQVTGDIPALYHLLRKHADANPDPETGLNRSISATYYFEAVPAFVINPEDTDSSSTAG